MPTGSGNDYAHTLGMSDDLSTALRRSRRATRKVVDLGLCNGVYFGESVAVGLDAKVTAKAVELKVTTRLSGLAALPAALIYVLNQPVLQPSVVVQYDDDAPFETDMLIVAATNGPTYGGGFKITPDAVYDDGLFDVLQDRRAAQARSARAPAVRGRRQAHQDEAGPYAAGPSA